MVFGGENDDVLPIVALGPSVFVFIREVPLRGGSVAVILPVPSFAFADVLNGGKVLDVEIGGILPAFFWVVPAFIQDDAGPEDVAEVAFTFVQGNIDGGFDDEATLQLDGEGGVQLDGDVRFGSSVSAGKELSDASSLLTVSSSALLDVAAPPTRGVASLEAAKA